MTTEERNRLVLENRGFAYHMARKFCRHPLVIWRMGERMDAIQIALLAMIEASEWYEEGRGCKYTSYVGMHMARVLQREIETGGVVRPGAGSSNIKKATKKTQLLQKRTARLYYLSGDYIGDYNDSGDWVIDEYNDQQDIEDEEQKAKHIRLVWILLEKLSERERYVIEQRYLHDRSQRDIAAEMNVSYQYIQQTEAIALERMRVGMKTDENKTPTERRREAALRKWNELFPEEQPA